MRRQVLWSACTLRRAPIVALAVGLSATALLIVSPAAAESKPRAPRTALNNVFDRLMDVDPSGHFTRSLEFQEVTAESIEKTQPEKPAAPAVEQSAPISKPEIGKLPENYPPPLFRAPQVKPVAEAPDSFKSIVSSIDAGDEAGMRSATSHFVDYLSELMFKVNLIARLITEEMTRRREISEEDAEAAIDYVSHTLAAAREAQGFPVRIDYKTAMKNVTADPEGQANVYYFFTLNCSYCRQMAPDVERLWRATLSDPKVRIAVLTMGPQPKAWIDSYRSYTGLTMPIMNGEKMAKKLGVSFAPTIVVVAPTLAKAYRIVGQQSFEDMLTFVRTVQGKPTGEGMLLEPAVQQAIATPIGQLEKMQAKNKPVLRRASHSQDSGGGLFVPKPAAAQTIERF